MTAQTVTQAKKTTRAVTPKATVYGFVTTPTGPLLRAYFVALATAQTGGKIAVGRKFKLWAKANIHGHVQAGRVTQHPKAGYSFTADGKAYFTDPKHAPSDNLFAQMVKAVATGHPPKNCYNVPMVAIQ